MDQFGITVEGEDLKKLTDGDQDSIDRLFRRVERYVTILADANFLKFDNLSEIDFQEQDDDPPVVTRQASHDYNVAKSDVDESFGLL